MTSNRVGLSNGVNVLLMAAMLNAPVLRARAANVTAPPAELDKAFAAFAAAARAADRKHFDPQAVLEAVGREPDKLTDWVRRNTAYVPYHGALRGPAGVLMDGTSNACDRAWLLADMLRSSGYDMRLARATLDDAEAKVILTTAVAPQRPALNTEPISDAHAAELAKATDTDVADVKASDAASLATARDAVTLIRERTATQGKAVLAAAAAFKSAGDADDAFALAAAKAHWWVQAKVGDAWRDFDPTRPDDAMPVAAASTVDVLEAAGLGKATNDAFGGLVGGGGASQAGVLSAETIEYTVHSPGRPDLVVRRPVFDLIGPAGRAAPSSAPIKVSDDDRAKRARLITARIDVLPLGGDLHADGIMAVQTRAAARLHAFVPQIGKAETFVSAYEKTHTPDLLYTTQLLRQAVAPRPTRTYLDRPNILTAYRTLGADGKALTSRVTIDVSYNPVGVRPAAGGEDAFAVRVMQGVADTAAERAVLRGEDDTIENTTELFARAGDATPVAAQKAADLPAAAKALSADVQARVAGQLGEGYALVMPPAPVNGSAGPRFGWYRVNPKTGDTIGVNDAGFNAATAEKAAVDKLNALRAPGAEPITSLGEFAKMGLEQVVQRMGYTIESISGPAERALWEKLTLQFVKWTGQNTLKFVKYGAWA